MTNSEVRAPLNVLVNASTIIKGGGIQVAASFIAQTTLVESNINWQYCLSAQVAEELSNLKVELPQFHLFETSPSRSQAQRRRLADLEKTLSPSAVFTIFGPAYVRFAAPHLCGVAACWVTHSTWLAYKALPSWSARLRNFVTCGYQGLWFGSADRWVVEASNAKGGLVKRIGLEADNIAVVPNTCAAIFPAAGIADAVAPKEGETVRLLYVTAYYPHKNLELIPAVAAALRDRDATRDYEFIITLPGDEPALGRIKQRARGLNVEKSINNVGRVSLNEVISLYDNAHICFMPSLLETFSASYPEAMAMGRPIVASDLGFARAVCSDAAVYFEPTSADDAAQKIVSLSNDQPKWNELIRRGKEVLNSLPTARQKHDMYVDLLRDLTDH